VRGGRYLAMSFSGVLRLIPPARRRVASTVRSVAKILGATLRQPGRIGRQCSEHFDEIALDEIALIDAALDRHLLDRAHEDRPRRAFHRPHHGREHSQREPTVGIVDVELDAIDWVLVSIEPATRLVTPLKFTPGHERPPNVAVTPSAIPPTRLSLG
jgi:hypothetical protein